MSPDFITRSVKTSTIAGGFWKGAVQIADIEELEMMEASEVYPRRINAKEVLITQKGEEFIFCKEYTSKYRKFYVIWLRRKL